VNGFPTFVLLNSAGRELGRQVGYLKGGPDAFIAKLEGFSGK
jgi:thioredoxin-related protein